MHVARRKRLEPHATRLSTLPTQFRIATCDQKTGAPALRVYLRAILGYRRNSSAVHRPGA
jgi:hypothetical protein